MRVRSNIRCPQSQDFGDGVFFCFRYRWGLKNRVLDKVVDQDSSIRGDQSQGQPGEQVDLPCLSEEG